MRLTGDQIARAAALAAVVLVAIVVALLLGKGIFPNSDCKPSGGEVAPTEGNPGRRIADPQVVGGRAQGTFPHIDATSYGAGEK